MYLKQVSRVKVVQASGLQRGIKDRRITKKESKSPAFPEWGDIFNCGGKYGGKLNRETAGRPPQVTRDFVLWSRYHSTYTHAKSMAALKKLPRMPS